MGLRGLMLQMQRVISSTLTGRVVSDPHPTNPYSRAQPHLRRAYAEGTRAARPDTPPRDYVCETRAQRLAWLEGFLAMRVARTGRTIDPGLSGA